METIDVQIVKIRFPSTEQDEEKRNKGEKSLFYILEVGFNGLNITAKGELTVRPQLNERYKLSGTFVVWQGQRQFSFRKAEISLPIKQRDLLKYACEITSGFGPAMEQRIWDALGETWQTIDQGDIAEISGLTQGKLNALQTTISRLKYQRQESEAKSYILSLGATLHMAQIAWETWGESTVPKIKENCYSLVELPNYGFDDADRLRSKFGIADDDPRRIRACTMYCMRLVTAQGDSAVTWTELSQAIYYKLPQVPAKAVCRIVSEMFNAELVPFRNEKELSLLGDYQDDAEIFNYVTEAVKNK